MSTRTAPDGEAAAKRDRARAFSRAARQLGILPDNDAVTLQTRVFQGLRGLIAQGALAAGDRLPSSRRLAEDLGVSRNTVVSAFEQLAADGWIDTRQGSGSYVAAELPGAAAEPRGPPSSRAEAAHLPFAAELTGLDLFPMAVWNRLQASRWRRMERSALQEGDSAGWSGLRHAIAAWLSISRGLQYAPEQVIVTNSARGALFLASQVLLRAGDQVLVEDPGYFGANDALRASGAVVVPVAVDDEGFCITQGERDAPSARMAVVTPHCQFPTGAVLSPQRRAALLDWARRRSAWIIEDAFDSEINFGAARPASLLSEGGDRVILLNSFNRILFPSLRIGYIVVPGNLVESFTRARGVLDGHSNIPNQMVLRDFIDAGHFDDHIRRCREAFGERRAVLLEAGREHLPPYLDLIERDGGLHVLAAPRLPLTAASICNRARQAGLDPTPVSRLMERDGPEERIMLGFSGFSPTVLRRSVMRLRSVCQSLAEA